MINRLIELSLRNRFIVIALFVALAGWGWWAVKATPIDAIPDLSDNQVIVFTDWPGHGPQEVEDQITYPMTVSLQGLAGVRVVRSQSAFGFSMIYAVFEDNVDLYFARARVLERMSLVAKALPAGVVPTLGPDATGVGHVFWYTLESPTHLTSGSPEPAGLVRSLPAQCGARRGGGRVGRRLRPAVPDRRRPQPFAPVRAAAQCGRLRRPRQQLNVGGNVLESNGAWLIVRGVGLVASVDDVKKIVIGASNGTPMYVEQVANVQIGDAFRVASLGEGIEGSGRAGSSSRAPA